VKDNLNIVAEKPGQIQKWNIKFPLEYTHNGKHTKVEPLTRTIWNWIERFSWDCARQWEMKRFDVLLFPCLSVKLLNS